MINKINTFNIKKGLLISVIAAAFTTSAMATDVKVSGFMTVAGGKTSGDSARGYNNDDVKFQPDSVAGVQVTARVNDEMSATVQLVGRYEDDDSQVDMEWAYINYNLTDELTVQAGRFRPAVYLYSSTLDVGYSYLWISTPSEIYGQVPMTYTDGVNLLYSYTFDNDISLSASAFYSNVNLDLNIGGSTEFDVNAFTGGEVSISNDYFRLRAGYVEASMDADLSSIGIDSSSPNALQIEETDAYFASVGLTIDYEDILFIGEYAVRNIEDSILVEDTDAYYATLGYRIGKFTPHVTYAEIETDYKVSSTGVAPLDGAINGARSSQATDSETITIGLRYDINPYAALKFEYSNIEQEDQTTAATEYDSDLYRIALNIVF